jgi:hypothetical protein
LDPGRLRRCEPPCTDAPSLGASCPQVPPAKVLVLGGGVAGLSAVQTAKNMGAIVTAYDVRPAAKEQVPGLTERLCVQAPGERMSHLCVSHLCVFFLCGLFGGGGVCPSRCRWSPWGASF